MKLFSSRILTQVLLITALFISQLAFAKKQNEKRDCPNFIIIFVDDMGYGDMSINGHPTIKTPNLDRMATEGQKWTNFYVAAPVCTPSRAGLMTGRLPIRSGMCSSKKRVLFPDSKGGLPEKEITIAKALKQKDYATACIGKWHLGHLPQYTPTSHGFDYFFGIPYSNDMDRIDGPDNVDIIRQPKIDYFNVPLMRNSEIIERPADQTTITKRYTEEAVKFIGENKDNPFFIYLAHSMPHVPLFRSKKFEGISLRGTYGDVIAEIDWSVGRVMEALKKNGIAENTLVVFTSDNGPWLIHNENGGSAGLLKGGKGGTYEGGMREPTVFWWPGTLKEGVVCDMATTMDLLPTISKLAGVQLPTDRVYDGYDIFPIMTGKGKSDRDVVFYYRDTEVFAVRKGAYKAHFFTQADSGRKDVTMYDPPLLYNLNVDPSEKYNIADQHPDIIVEIKKIKEEHEATVVPVENQLEKR
ncbi:sulfatase family protein [Sunxiuqinia sp. A32]|uniref:sulfatase family protein n=1 Tax=Sunxiuqinia sp. A32 TaxID=3461496 RepID=UPI004045A9F9